MVAHTGNDPIRFLKRETSYTRHVLLKNDLHTRIRTLPQLRRFMEHHVFAVWDFMSLLKTLQHDLTCLRVPWVPTANAATRRLINQLVLDQETDIDQQGRPASRFELYVRAMNECGADTAPVLRMVAALEAGRSVTQALDAAQASKSVREFVENTFAIIWTGKPHAVAAAFTFGREDLIPQLLREVVDELDTQFPGQLNTFIYCLDWHTQLAQQVQGPAAVEMVRELCADEPERWLECQGVIVNCLKARMTLWNGVPTCGMAGMAA